MEIHFEIVFSIKIESMVDFSYLYTPKIDINHTLFYSRLLYSLFSINFLNKMTKSESNIEPSS